MIDAMRARTQLIACYFARERANNCEKLYSPERECDDNKVELDATPASDQTVIMHTAAAAAVVSKRRSRRRRRVQYGFKLDIVRVFVCVYACVWLECAFVFVQMRTRFNWAPMTCCWSCLDDVKLRRFAWCARTSRPT